MNDTTSLPAERAALAAQIDAWRSENDALRTRWDELSARDDALSGRWVKGLTDADIVNDEEVRRELSRLAYAHGGAANRRRPFIDGPFITSHGVDARDNETGGAHYLPSPQVTLETDSDVPDAVAELEAWFKRWALGRSSLSVSVFESTLSEFGSYVIEYRPGVEAVLVKFTYGSRRELHRGSTVEVFAYVAKNHPYHSTRSDDYEEDDY